MKDPWTALNVVAWVGWFVVGMRLCVFAYSAPRDTKLWELSYIKESTTFLELLCCIEVVRMLVGNLRGNVALGVGLHYIRMFMVLKILPLVGAHLSLFLVLAAWSLTEICRYPYYILGGDLALRLRYAMPVLTFPLGALSEAWACYTVLPLLGSGFVYRLTAFQILFNVGSMGPIYPGIASKGIKALMGSSSKKKKTIEGVQFPVTNSETGERSTTRTGKDVWVAAASALPDGHGEKIGARIAKEKDWRHQYPRHVTSLAEATLVSPEAALSVARAGLAKLYASLVFVRGDEAMPLPTAMKRFTAPTLRTVTVSGGAPMPSPLRLSVPISAGGRGNSDPKPLTGAALEAQLEAWVASGELEPDTKATLLSVMANDEWLDLRGRCFVVFGANSEVGPCRHLLALGATVAAVGTRRKDRWASLIAYARTTHGTLLVPVATTGAHVDADDADDADDAATAAAAGANLLTEAPEIRTWLASCCFAPLTIGCYTYLDGDMHVRVNLACDAIVEALAAETAFGKGAALHYLGSPGTAHVVPPAAHAAAEAAASAAPSWQKLWLALSVFVKAARLPIQDRTSGAAFAVLDGLVVLQGPSYALAKQLQMWRAVLARADGHVVSTPMAPAVRTDSMIKVATIRASLAGAPYFGSHSYEPATASAVMALLLVAHVRDPKSAHASPAMPLQNPTEAFALDGFTGGLWRAPYTSQSTGAATVILGYIAPRV